MPKDLIQNIEGLSEEENELFILSVQRDLPRLKKIWLDARALVLEKEEELSKLRSQETYACRILTSVVKFLTLYNSDACDDWFAEVGLKSKENT